MINLIEKAKAALHHAPVPVLPLAEVEALDGGYWNKQLGKGYRMYYSIGAVKNWKTGNWDVETSFSPNGLTRSGGGSYVGQTVASVSSMSEAVEKLTVLRQEVGPGLRKDHYKLHGKTLGTPVTRRFLSKRLQKGLRKKALLRRRGPRCQQERPGLPAMT